jgi:hypothetical protein
MDRIVNINSINPETFELQTYSSADSSLIASFEVETSFNPSVDKVEYFIYDLNGQIVYSNVNGYPNYSLVNNVVTLDPEKDLIQQGFNSGQYNTLYNFVSPKLSSSPTFPYFISEISSDGTEVRLDTTIIPNQQVISSSLELINSINTTTGSYYDFYLDFGDNNLIIAVNALLDTSSIDNPTVLIKLYEPLPATFPLQTQCWVVTQVGNSVAYNIDINYLFDNLDNNVYLKGPNYNLDLLDQINNSTDYINYDNLKNSTSSLAQGTGSFNYQLNNILAQTGININIDYSNYSNFIHFSSALTRLENFYYKLGLLEDYTYSASLSNSASSGSYYVSSSNIIWQNKIDAIITTFDSYEYYLYYSSGSSAWPKTTSNPPYTNYTTTSVSGSAWFVSQSLVAEEYDIENNNALVLAIPSYIREDSDNANYELFVEMIGQLFDNVFLYLQNITTKFDADNRLNYGVSKDLVADILRDAGITIYQNNFSSNDLYQALLGITPSGSLYNLPYTTTQYPVPSGSFLDYITNYVTASSTSSLFPTDDINKEQYKRIYHNLPLLLKKKGSVAGLRDLITTFGIPDTILRINEFGGKDKNINSYDNWQDEYNYSFYTSGSSYISSSFELNTLWGATGNVPRAVEFRFKTDGLPTNTASISNVTLFEAIGLVNQQSILSLRYTGSGYVSASYSGSIPSPYNEYAILEFVPDRNSPTISSSIYLPFYDGGWWSVLVNTDSTTGFTLYAANKNYNGEDGNTVSFQASSSVTAAQTVWNDTNTIYFGREVFLPPKLFTGSYQEIRYYTQPITKDNFDSYVMNPYSIESSEYLAFRASLGGELYTGSKSIHPKVTGSWVTTSSFAGTSNFYLSGSYSWIPNTEVLYFDQVPAGIQNAISQKIKIGNTVLPYSSSLNNIPNANVLSPFRSIQQDPQISQSYTRDIDYVEIAFSPQNEINEDINSEFGYFNIGEIIGDPRFQSSSLDYYPELADLSYGYFEKYESNYDWNDYIRLIKFFDNSLFKLLQDFTPARASLASGIVIKNTLLDRNRYRAPQVSPSSSIAFIGSGSTNIPYIVEDQTITGSIKAGTIEGTNGGSMPELFGQTSSVYSYPGVVNVNQVWYGSTPSLSGSVPFTESAQLEFFNGELSGSNLIATTGILSDCNVEIVQVYNTASLPLPKVLAGVYQFDGYKLNIEKTYYISFTLSNDAGASGTGGGRIFYFDEKGTDYVIYDNDTLAPGSTITITQLEISNVLGNKFSNSSLGTNPTTFNIPLYFVGLDQNIIFPSTPTLTNFTIYETYTEPDCLVLNNDAQVSRPSSRYMDVDFGGNQIIAINQQSILSGSAIKAAVPDSYYTTARITNPRYNGCEITTYASRSAAENYVEYFGYFKYIEPIARIPNTIGAVNLFSIIDITGKSTTINNGPISLGTVQDLFQSGTLATVLFPTTTTGSILTGSQFPVEVAGGFYGPGNNYPITESAFSVLLNNYFLNLSQSSNDGIIIPGNFNPYFTGSFTELAQQAGFFKTL